MPDGGAIWILIAAFQNSAPSREGPTRFVACSPLIYGFLTERVLLFLVVFLCERPPDMSTVVITDFTWVAVDIERAILEPLGCEVVERQCVTVAETIDACRTADQIISQYSPITAEVITQLLDRRANIEANDNVCF